MSVFKRWLIALACCATLDLSTGTAADPPLQIATFDIDATPPLGTPLCHGLVKAAVEVTAPLSIRGAVLLGAGDPIVLVACDWVGIANESYDVFRRDVANAVRTTADRVAVHCLHQHDAPGSDFAAERLLAEHGLAKTMSDAEFDRAAMRRVADAARDALDRAKTVTQIGLGSGRVEKVASNRRILGDDGRVKYVRYSATRDPMIAQQPEGVVDPLVRLIAFYHDDAPVAVLTYYATHPQSYYGKGMVNPDFPAMARGLREAALPGVPHIHMNGASGNVTAGKYNNGAPENRAVLAERLADGMKAAWESVVRHPISAADVSWQVEPIVLPPSSLINEPQAEALLNDATKPLIPRIQAARELIFARRMRNREPIPLSRLQLGPAAVVHMPGELFVEYQLLAQSLRPNEFVAMAAYGDYGPGYIGTAIAYQQGGYETGVDSRASRVGPESEAILTLALRRLLAPNPIITSKSGPLTPDDSLRAISAEPGLRVEMVAAEPMIESPVAFAFDENGRLFVAENRGYPNPPADSGPMGRIAMLEDLDGDGRMDRRTTCVEGLTFPNGLLPWNDGLIVTCAPDVLWLHDMDDEGLFRERDVLWTGFSTNGSTQLRVSHPTLGVDGMIYLTGGLTGGEVRIPGGSDPSIKFGRADFRFKPGTLFGETIDGGAQFGQSFDDFGRRFLCYNRVQVQHQVLSSADLKRNARLAWTETVHNGPRDVKPEPLKGHGSAAALFPLSDNVTTADSHAGTFTAACGVTIFRGDGLPEAYRGGAFSCDPTGNLVHFDRIEPLGATFSAARATPGREFLASTDNWFRPVFLGHGPDGALYVADMTRKTIEHPDYLPVEIRKRTDFEGGRTMGRIWRVIRDDWTPEMRRDRWKQALASAAEASSSRPGPVLGHSNGWVRDVALRRFHEVRSAMGGLNVARSVSTVRERWLDVVEDPNGSAEAISLAMRGLNFDDALPPATLVHMLESPLNRVRETAVELTRPRMKTHPELMTPLLARATDADARVRFVAALALGDVASDDSTRALAEILCRDPGDRWLRAAVLSGIGGRELAFHSALIQRWSPESPPFDRAGWQLWGRMLAAANDDSAALLKRILVDERPASLPAAMDLLNGVASTSRTREQGGSWRNILEHKTDESTRAAAMNLLTAARELVANGNGNRGDRAAAAAMLSLDGSPEVESLLLAQLTVETPFDVAAAALKSLVSAESAAVVSQLVDADRYRQYPPALRDAVTTSLFSDARHVNAAIMAVERGAIPKGAVDPLLRRQLLAHRDASIKARAAKLFEAPDGDRAAVYQSLKDAADLPGNADAGRGVFKKACSQCHRLDRDGYAVGPDLFGIRNQPKAAILLHILAPDHEITPGFAAYTAVLKDGRTLTGLLAAETPVSVTLKMAQGKEESLLRSDIDELTGSRQSLMPTGVEKNVSRQEIADLLAYLRGEQTQP